MKQNIYILNNQKFDDVYNLPIFQVNFLDCDIDFTQYDALVFTSKNALLALESCSIDTSWKTIPSYAIAPATAKMIKKLGGNLVFTGSNGHGDAFAYEIKEQLKNQKILYIRGKEVVSNLIDILKCDDVVVYQTICLSQTKKPPKDSIIIFSSPSTIKCFLKNFQWDSSYCAISIGKTTLKYFPNYIKPHLSDTTSLQGCVELAKKIRQAKN